MTSAPSTAPPASPCPSPSSPLSPTRSTLERERAARPVLVEKLAINNFRLGFLSALCPDAALINIVRHGVEVALSIQEKARLGHWYGLNDRKWTLLVEHAWANGYGPLVGL